MRNLFRVFMVLASAGLAPAGAVVITVETLVDADVAEGLCSLREAIVAANTDAAYRECPAGSGVDRIEFAVAGTILLAADLPEITASLDLVGPGTGGGSGGEIAVAIDGDNSFRPLHGTGGGSGGFSLRMSRLAFLRGHVADAGGCLAIPNGAELLDLRRVRFEDCSADGDGGAIDAFAVTQATIQDSTFTGNSAGGHAGAVRFWNFGALTVEDSTFSANAAGATSDFGSAGAILVSFVDLVLRRSTVSDNSAGGSAGGLSISGISTSTIESSTIVGNSAGVSTTTGAGGGVTLTTSVEITFANTVVAGNLDLSLTGASAEDIYISPGGAPPIVHTSGFNFIGNNNSVEATFPVGAGAGQPNAFGDFVGDDVTPLDPLLGALTDRGGPTWTRDPLSGSPLVDQGSCGGMARDQRGYFRLESGLRVVDDPAVANFAEGCDIGAVELGATDAEGLMLRGDFESGDLAAWSSAAP